MKTRAAILIVIWSLLLAEPVSANFNIKSNYSDCKKTDPPPSSCCKSSCSKPVEKEEEDCEGNRCNPLMSCPTGNFYTFSQPHLSIDALQPAKEKMRQVNDNRVIKHMADCWHPPEVI